MPDSFDELRQRSGMIFKRPGDDEPGYWIVLTPAERDALVMEARTLERRLAHSEFHRSSNRRSMRQRGKVIERLCERVERQRAALRALQGVKPKTLTPAMRAAMAAREFDGPTPRGTDRIGL